ncbi:MAG: hypothetical protein ACYDBY_07875 [Thermoanaerobaculia bacterium]
MRKALLLAAALLLGHPVPVRAATEGRFTLGLTGEALSTRSEVEGSASTISSLGGAVLLGVDGSVLDRRFLSFGGFLRYSLFDQTGGSGSDLRYDQWSYGGDLRLFSNRRLSVSGGVFHGVSTPTGEGRGAIVGGTQDEVRAEAALRTKGLPELSYAYHDYRFEADDPQTLRDESRILHTAKALATYGLFGAGLELRQEQLEFYSGGVRQDLRYGVLNLDVNRGGRNSWETVVNANQVRTATGGEPLSDPTTVLFTRSAFRHRFREDSSLDLSYSRQSAEAGDWFAETDQVDASTALRLSKSSLLDVRVSFLSTRGEGTAAVERLRQPSASIGLRWSRPLSTWNVLLSPRLSYVRAKATSRDAESGMGGELFLSAQRAWAGGASLLFDVEALYNDLAIAPVDANGGAPVDPSFLAGLERNRLRGRGEWSAPLGRRSRLYFRVEATHRVRLFEGRDLTESTHAGYVELAWRSLYVKVGGNRTRQKDAEIPTDLAVIDGAARWMATRWLQVDVVGTDERRNLQDVQGEYRYLEGGLTFLYAKLALYARYRESVSTGTDGLDRLDRRIWAGIRRSFEFPTLSLGASARRESGTRTNGNGGGRSTFRGQR